LTHIPSLASAARASPQKSVARHFASSKARKASGALSSPDDLILARLLEEVSQFLKFHDGTNRWSGVERNAVGPLIHENDHVTGICRDLELL
jgi:hypothetical protein